MARNDGIKTGIFVVKDDIYNIHLLELDVAEVGDSVAVYRDRIGHEARILREEYETLGRPEKYLLPLYLSNLPIISKMPIGEV